MFSELYTATSGMVTRQAQLDVLAHNLANVNSAAFKIEDLVSAERPIPTALGPVRAPAHVGTAGRWTDFSPGQLHATGESMDVALGAEGFFVIQAPTGVRLTRDGGFSLDGEGRLVLRGMPVLGRGGEIRLAEGSVEIREDGTVRQGGREVGRLRVVTVATPQDLVREGQGLFVAPEGAAQREVSDPLVLQGHVELSNANAVRLMVQMIDVVRGFEMHQKMLQTLDRLGEKAVQELGRVA
jgi:flagellar basal body rod protein FlgG